MADELFCDRCRKCLTYGEVEIMGLGITFEACDAAGIEEHMVQHQLGRYYPKTKFNFCYECLIRAMKGE